MVIPTMNIDMKLDTCRNDRNFKDGDSCNYYRYETWNM